MKNRLKYIVLLFAFTALLFACEEQTTPDSVRIQFPDDQSPILRDDAYYARLRAYKLTDHKLAFGWYGSWTAVGSTEQTRLKSAPDSMDIISIWSKWHTLNKEQIADKAFVQKIKGTKVVYCISAKDVPEEFKEDGVITDASLVAYAKAWGKDSMDKYEYDGMDIDFETAIDHQGPLNTTPGLFKKFCQELSQYIGPKSSTGRLFLIDGNIDQLDDGIAELCSYGVSQAYNCGGYSNLEGRTRSAAYAGWKPESLIFTENFESLWQNGGVTYMNKAGQTMPSLIGMADFAATSGSAGFGSYHMEYEYGHADMPYKYIRRAIQLANPAPKGDYTKNLVTLNEAGEEKFTVVVFPSGASEPFTTTATGELSAITAANADIPLKVDNSLVATYNDYYYTEYKTIDPALVSFSGPMHFVAQTLASETPVTISIADMSSLDAESEYLLPVRLDFASTPSFSANTNKQIKYIFIKKVVGTNKVTFTGAGTVDNISIALLPSGDVIGEISKPLTINLSANAPQNVSIPLVADPALVAAYNTKNGTSYTAIAAQDITISGKFEITQGSKDVPAVTVSVADIAKVPMGTSMIAVGLNMTGLVDYQIDENLKVKYFIIKKEQTNIENGATSVTGTPIADMKGWVYSIQGTNGVEFGGLTDTNMFNGDNLEMGWYSSVPGLRMVTVDMAKTQTVVGFRMGMVLGNTHYMTLKLYDIQTSNDGSTWKNESAAPAVNIGAADVGKWQYIKFYSPVQCRYVRLSYKNENGSSSNAFIGCSEFNAIAPNN